MPGELGEYLLSGMWAQLRSPISSGVRGKIVEETSGTICDGDEIILGFRQYFGATF